MSSMRRAAVPASGIDDAEHLAADHDRSAISPLRSIEGQSGLRPTCCGDAGGNEMGMDIDGLGHNAFPRYCYAPHQFLAHILRAEPAMLLYKQVGLFFNMDAIEE